MLGSSIDSCSLEVRPDCIKESLYVGPIGVCGPAKLEWAFAIADHFFGRVDPQLVALGLESQLQLDPDVNYLKRLVGSLRNHTAVQHK